MSTDTIRRAAAAMRASAEAATPGPWSNRRGPAEHVVTEQEAIATVVSLRPREDRRHIASWHPTVALAVADWLDRAADDHDQWHGVREACRDLYDNPGGSQECGCAMKDCYKHGLWHDCTCGTPDLSPALVVARTYLKEES